MAIRNTRYRSVAPALIEQRRAFRHPVMFRRASVRRHAAHEHEAQLADLSIYGCRITTKASCEVNDRIWLRLNGSLPIAATAIWSDGNSIGCRFDAPIDKALFRSLTLAAE